MEEELARDTGERNGLADIAALVLRSHARESTDETTLRELHDVAAGMDESELDAVLVFAQRLLARRRQG